MTDDEVRKTVRTTLAVLTQLATRTRTSADDLFLQIVRQNEGKLTTAVADLLKDSTPPTSERISAALVDVGIRA